MAANPLTQAIEMLPPYQRVIVRRGLNLAFLFGALAGFAAAVIVFAIVAG